MDALTFHALFTLGRCDFLVDLSTLSFSVYKGLMKNSCALQSNCTDQSHTVGQFNGPLCAGGDSACQDNQARAVSGRRSTRKKKKRTSETVQLTQVECCFDRHHHTYTDACTQDIQARSVGKALLKNNTGQQNQRIYLMSGWNKHQPGPFEMETKSRVTTTSSFYVCG